MLSDLEARAGDRAYQSAPDDLAGVRLLHRAHVNREEARAVRRCVNVDDKQPATRAQHARRLGDRRSAHCGGKLVQPVRGHHDVEVAIVEWQGARISVHELDTPEALCGGPAPADSEHLRRQVEGVKLGGWMRPGDEPRQIAGSRTDLEHAAIALTNKIRKTLVWPPGKPRVGPLEERAGQEELDPVWDHALASVARARGSTGLLTAQSPMS